MNFCPSCGTKRHPQWQFCAQCGAPLAGEPKRDTRPSPFAGLTVFCVLALVGLGGWLRILSPKGTASSGGSPAATNFPTANSPSAGSGASLPDGHPPIGRMELPEDVKTFIANLASEAENHPGNTAAWERLAEVQHRVAGVNPAYYEDALGSYAHVLKLEPEHTTALRGMASVYYDLGDYSNARPHLEKYLTLESSDLGARTDLATVRLRLGEVEQAIVEYREVIETDPRFFHGHLNLGIALYQTGKAREGLKALQRARELAPDEATRTQVERLIAEVGRPPGKGAKRLGAPAPEATPFQQHIEKFFRGHEVMGPKIDAVTWKAPRKAVILVHDFPLAATPSFAREILTDRIREAIREAKKTAAATGIAEVAIVDSATRTVMETVTE